MDWPFLNEALDEITGRPALSGEGCGDQDGFGILDGGVEPGCGIGLDGLILGRRNGGTGAGTKTHQVQSQNLEALHGFGAGEAAFDDGPHPGHLGQGSQGWKLGFPQGSSLGPEHQIRPLADAQCELLKTGDSGTVGETDRKKDRHAEGDRHQGESSPTPLPQEGPEDQPSRQPGHAAPATKWPSSMRRMRWQMLAAASEWVTMIRAEPWSSVSFANSANTA